jgi:hypothetical protein
MPEHQNLPGARTPAAATHTVDIIVRFLGGEVWVA